MQALVRWHGSRPVSSGIHDVLTSVLVSTGCFVAATPACVVVRGTRWAGPSRPRDRSGCPIACACVVDTYGVLTSGLVSTGYFVAETPACVVVRGTGRAGRPAQGTLVPLLFVQRNW